ncbi:hypothetical protein ACIQZG_08485 [Lysinibacillus sp. NPDC096418]|uniref:hypothetical protein n=1 Tax=Lysinibacillus sp. NPDC096418 TaxID=3364138 RepID=UPI00380BE74A
MNQIEEYFHFLLSTDLFIVIIVVFFAIAVSSLLRFAGKKQVLKIKNNVTEHFEHVQ